MSRWDGYFVVLLIFTLNDYSCKSVLGHSEFQVKCILVLGDAFVLSLD